MDNAKAKYFLFDDQKTHKLYKSKDLQTLLNMNDNRLTWILAVIDTESGDTVMDMDWSYAGEPIIMHRITHLKFYLDWKNKPLIDLDNGTLQAENDG